MPAAIPAAHRAVLEALEHAGRACTLKELAELTGRHPSTVRDHLAELVAWGVLTTRLRPPAGRGRPARLYSPAGPGSHTASDLASALAAEVAAGSPAPREAAVRVGRSLSRGTVESEPELLGALSRSGYDPEAAAPSDPRDRAEVHLHHCPFLETARAATDLMCPIHEAMIDAWLEGGSLSGQRARLVPRLVRDGAPCVLTLRRRTES